MSEQKNIWIAGKGLINNGEADAEIKIMVEQLGLKISGMHLTGNNGNGKDLLQIEGPPAKLKALKLLLKSTVVM